MNRRMKLLEYACMPVTAFFSAIVALKGGYPTPTWSECMGDRLPSDENLRDLLNRFYENQGMIVHCNRRPMPPKQEPVETIPVSAAKPVLF